MSRDTLVRVVVVCEGGLIVYTLYVLLSEPTFPWALMIAVIAVSAVLMFLLRNILFGDVRPQREMMPTKKSEVVRHGIWSLIGSVVGLLAGLLYSYLTHQMIRWETYVGILVPMFLFAIALWVHWLRHGRKRKHS